MVKIIALTLLLGLAACSQPIRTITKTEFVDVPVVEVRYAGLPGFITDPVDIGDFTIQQHGELICMLPADALEVMKIIDQLQYKLNAAREYDAKMRSADEGVDR